MKPLDLKLDVATGDTLDVRSFRVDEAMNAPFSVELTAVSRDACLDLEGLVGEEARFTIADVRSWAGVVRDCELLRVEPNGLSTYRLEIVPRLWLLGQRRNYRIFQRMSEPAMALLLLEEWQIAVETRFDSGAYPRRDYRVQYGETDLAFVARMLEDAGIAGFFEERGTESVLVLTDATHVAPPRRPLPFADDPTTGAAELYVTALAAGRRIKPGRYTIRDTDYRLPPSHPLFGSAESGKRLEAALESYHYVPGAFLYEGAPDATPVADDKMAARSSEAEAKRLISRRLEAKRGDAVSYSFRSNALDLKPGSRVSITGHPMAVLESTPLLVTSARLSGDATGAWTLSCQGRRGDVSFRPALVTPKPRVQGVETATVVGPEGAEIHTDEHGRVRVHFHWDRQSRMNDESSCWIPVSHPWAGAGFGGVNIPRVGHEVIVDFLGGDPDRPVVVGRVYTAARPVPYKLPDQQTQSGWKSSSIGHGGGYNEIMFEDAKGEELVRIQAEKDLSRLVKHDEQDFVRHDRAREVGNDEEVMIGHNRTARIVANDRVTVGHSQNINIGVHRASSIGGIDSTTVGEMLVNRVVPPGEGGPNDCTCHVLKPGEFLLDSGKGASLRGATSSLLLFAFEGIHLQSGGSQISILPDRVQIIAPKVTIIGGETDIKGKPIKLNCD